VNEPQASLIFINWNSADLVLRAVQSIVEKEDNAQDRFHIIVVDNGSSNDSLAVFESELIALFPAATVIALESNRGFAVAANRGLAAIETTYAFVLNADIEFINDAATRLINCLDSNPKAVLACPRLLREDGSEQSAAVPLPSLFFELTNRSLARRLMKIPANQSGPVPSIVGPCMAVHMKRLPVVGMLDERFFFFFEETDWCKRIQESEYEVYFDPTADVFHLQGQSVNQFPLRARIQFYESRYIYFKKHFGKRSAILLRAGLCVKVTANVLLNIIAVIVTGFRLKSRQKLGMYWGLWKWHVRGCPQGYGFEA